MANEKAEIRFMDNPITLRREYMFRVSLPQTMLFKEYVAFLCIVKCLWKAVRHGKQKAAD